MDSETRRMVGRELQRLQERHRFNRGLMGHSDAIRLTNIGFLSKYFHVSCEEIMEVIHEDGIERQI